MSPLKNAVSIDPLNTTTTGLSEPDPYVDLTGQEHQLCVDDAVNEQEGKIVDADERRPRRRGRRRAS